MVEFFPDYVIENMDTRKESITLENLLTMSDGMDWHEIDYPYDDPRNTLGQMWVSHDAVQHILDRPMAREPGESWAYNSGTSILLGGILEEVTERDIADFAREFLFGPIGIDKVWWSKTTGGHYHTDGGLWMTPRDMARFGYLMLNRGTWDGDEIVSSEWVSQSATAQFETPWGYGYGYQWWTLPDVDAYAATGHYEQRIFVVPRADLVVVFTANIADEDPHPADGFLRRFIVPACTDVVDADPVETYAKYGFSFDHPIGVQVVEAPIPGRATISDDSGIVQFNSQFLSLELVTIIWDQADEDAALKDVLREFTGRISEATGLEYDWGGLVEEVKGEHEVLLQFFRTTVDSMPFSGVMSIWRCEQTGRVYLMMYAVTPEKGDEEIAEALRHHLASLTCHGVE
jgi:hypothetical protein